MLQAAIASLQSADPINWWQITALYRRLAQLTGSPVVELNHAVGWDEPPKHVTRTSAR